MPFVFHSIFLDYVFADVLDVLGLTSAGSISDTDDLVLGGAYDITTFESSNTLYAAVTSFSEGGVQIISLADPTEPVPAGSIRDTDDLVLGGAYDITTFESSNTLYAAVTSSSDDGVQIISLADPNNPVPAGSISGTRLPRAWRRRTASPPSSQTIPPTLPSPRSIMRAASR